MGLDLARSARAAAGKQPVGPCVAQKSAAQPGERQKMTPETRKPASTQAPFDRPVPPLAERLARSFEDDSLPPRPIELDRERWDEDEGSSGG